jgi:tetratricopeptide (TPR) repeat protein
MESLPETRASPAFRVTLSNFGRLLQRLGKPAEAESLLRRALTLQVEAKERLEAAKTRIRLAEVLQEQGRLDDADAQYAQAIPELVDILPEKSPDLLAARARLARLRLAQNRPAEAEADYRAVIALTPAEGPTAQALLPVFRGGLGASLLALGRFDEAEPELVAAFEGASKEGQPAAERAKAARRVVELYEKWGRAAEAERYRAMLPPE